MIFRGSSGDASTRALPADPLGRFVELHEALEAGRGWMGDRVPLRFAAMTLLTASGDAHQLAETVRAHAHLMSRRLGWFTQIATALQLVAAAALIRSGDAPEPFLDDFEACRSMLRARAIRWSSWSSAYVFLSSLVLRARNEGCPITEVDVQRLEAIYQEMKRYHRWLTGPEDLPACAMLVHHPASVEEIGHGIEQVYQALRDTAGLWPGDSLQTAANILFMLGLEPQETALRFSAIRDAFRLAGAPLGAREHDEVATLCFLATPVQRIAQSVLGFRDALRDQLSALPKSMAFSLGTSLAFIQLVGDDGQLGALADAKLMLDMQQIIAARAAAAAAGAS